MRSTDFGPVPISRMKAESNEIFEALEQGRRVLISKRGRVVSVINPPSASRMVQVAAYALPGPRVLSELTASQINDSASPAVAAAENGETLYVTRDDHVFGFLEAAVEDGLDTDDLTVEQAEEIDMRLLEYAEAHADSTAEDLRRYREGLIGEAERPDLGVEGFDLLIDPLTLVAAAAPIVVSPATHFAFDFAQRLLREELEEQDLEGEGLEMHRGAVVVME